MLFIQIEVAHFKVAFSVNQRDVLSTQTVQYYRLTVFLLKSFQVHRVHEVHHVFVDVACNT